MNAKSSNTLVMPCVLVPAVLAVLVTVLAGFCSHYTPAIAGPVGLVALAFGMTSMVCSMLIGVIRRLETRLEKLERKSDKG
jgi:hypothetical protein